MQGVEETPNPGKPTVVYPENAVLRIKGTVLYPPVRVPVNESTVEQIIRLGCAEAPAQNDAGKPYHPNNQTFFTKKSPIKPKCETAKKKSINQANASSNKRDTGLAGTMRHAVSNSRYLKFQPKTEQLP